MNERVTETNWEKLSQLQEMMTEPLRPELARCVEYHSPELPKVLRHPLVVQPFIIPGAANRLFEENTRRLRRAKSCLEKVFVYQRPYRLERVVSWHRERRVAGDELRELLAAVWKDMESGDTLEDPLVPEILAIFKEMEFTGDMGQEPPQEQLTIYRGGAPAGIAWSRSLETARWFARRWASESEPPEPVFQAAAPPEAVYALLDGRGESEVVVDPGMLRELARIQN